MQAWLKRVSMLVAVVVGMTVAIPIGQSRPDGPSEFPLARIWDALTTRPAWSFDRPSTPSQKVGIPLNGRYSSSTELTRANGGNGRAPGKVRGALDPYKMPAEGDSPKRTTGKALEGFVAATSKRLASEATATSDVFENADGSYTRRVSAGPVNYRAPDGTWQPIDTSLLSGADRRLRTTSSATAISLAGGHGGRPADRVAAIGGEASPSLEGELVSMTLPAGERIGYELVGAVQVQPIVSGSTATYRGILPATDVELTALAAGIKETLVLRSRSAATSWVFPLRLEGLTARISADGSVELINNSGNVAATVPPGYMEDSRADGSGDGARSDAVTYALTTWNGLPALRVTADAAWIADPARIFPIKVDPTFVGGSNASTYVQSPFTNNNSAAAELKTGYHSSGPYSARAFVKFDAFSSAYQGRRISSAKLNVHVFWSGSCPSSRASMIEAFDIGAAWSSAAVTKWSNQPALGGSMGSLTAVPNSTVCGNTSSNPQVGQYWGIDLNAAGLTTLNRWTAGGANYGIAVVAPLNNNDDWKKISSVNTTKPPYLDVTYTPNLSPQLEAQHPPHAYAAPTLTPELVAMATDLDSWPKPLTYKFEVFDSSMTKVADSGDTPIAARNWVVPAGKLEWGKTYLWNVWATDGDKAAIPKLHVLTTQVPQPLITAGLSQNVSAHGFDPRIGNYTTQVTDANVATAGPPLAVKRSYNSRDPRVGSAFGAGWSSVLDAKVTVVDDVAIVTMPSGQDVAYGRRADGTYAPPSGGLVASIKPESGGVGYVLADNDGTKYYFIIAANENTFRLSKVVDSQNRELKLEESGGQYTAMVGASGRRLWLEWTTGATPRVKKVRTDPVDAEDPNSANIWEYLYTGDRLTSVCPPTSSTHCTQYVYGSNSLYPTAVLDAAPHTYLRLNDAGISPVAATSAVDSLAGGPGKYFDVTPAVGELPGSEAHDAVFNGSSSRVELAKSTPVSSSYAAISLWFKTTGSGVLYSFQSVPLSDSAAANWNPALYVDVNGMLRGKLSTGSGAATMSSSVNVADDNWHHAALVASGNTQTLYLDGLPKDTLAGQIVTNGTGYAYVGAGKWQDSPDTSGAVGYFSGHLRDFAFYTKPLTDGQIASMHQSGRVVATPLEQITRPTGGVQARVDYSKLTGAVSKVTDANGGVWQIGAPSRQEAHHAYRSAVLSRGPLDYFRLADSGPETAVNEVNGNVARYNQMTLGVDGSPFGADIDVASFNGSTSYLQLPPEDKPKTKPASMSLWFQMPAGSTAGGVLWSYQSLPLAESAQAGGWIPGLYVGTDGKLRGQLFWTGAISPMTSDSAVNDGNWHHVAISGSPAEGKQYLYLDGALIKSLSGTVVTTATENYESAYLGAGKWTSWPSAGTGEVGYWPGQLAEYAYFAGPLTTDQVQAQFAARTRGVSWLGLYAGTGTGGVNAEAARISAQCGDATAIAMPGDWDGDGKADMVCRGLNGVLYLHRGNGAGGFSGGGVEFASGFGEVTLIWPGDFSGDGKPDLVYRRPTDGNLLMIRGDGGGGWIDGTSIEVGWGWEHATFSGGDFSGDGKPDFLWRREADKKLLMVKGNGNGGWIDGVSIEVGTGWGGRDHLTSRGDFDGDGKPDVLFRDTTDKKLYYVKGNGAGGFLTGTPILVSGDHADKDVIAAPGDLTGDGKADVLFRSTADPERSGALAGVPTNVVKVTDPDGKTIENVYDISAGGRQIEVTDARGGRTTFGFDTSGFLRTVTDPNKNTVVTEHDSRGNVTAKITCQDWSASLCSTTYFSYFLNASDPADLRNGKLTEVRDPRSESATDNRYLTTYSYDPMGNLVEVTDPLGRKQKAEYTSGTTPPAGLPSKVIAAGGGTQVITYKPNGDMAEVTDAAGLRTQFTYDGIGRVVEQKVLSDAYPAGLITRIEYDRLDRVKTHTEPKTLNRVTNADHTKVTTNIYDWDGQITSTTFSDSTGDDASRTVLTEYNSFGQKKSQTDGKNNKTFLEYDAFGRVLKQTAPDGTVSETKYDEIGNPLTRKVNGQLVESNVYDAAGRLAATEDAMLWKTLYTYTDNNLLATTTRIGAMPQDTFVLEANEYDVDGKLKKKETNNRTTITTYGTDVAGRTEWQTVDPLGENRTVSFVYGADDTVLSARLSGPSGSQTVDALYDSSGRMTWRGLRMPGGTGGPDGWWQLNELAGTTANDETAANRDGTWQGSASWFDGGAKFTGNGEIGTQGSPVVSTTQSFTISAWAKVSAGSGGTFVSQDGNWRSGFEIYYGGQWSVVKPCGDGNWGGIWLDSGVAATPDKWTHIAVVFDNAAGDVLSIYVDGVLKGSATNCGAGFNATGSFVIGRGKYNNQASGRFTGGVDNVQAYGKVLNAAEISILHQKGRAGTALHSNEITTSWVRDQHGRVKSETDPNGNVTHYFYDEADRLVQTHSPTVSTEENGVVTTAPIVTTVGYDTFGGEVETRDGTNRQVTYKRDANGQVFETISPSYTQPGAGATFTQTSKTFYDTVGRIDYAEDHLGRKTYYTYDHFGQIKTIKTPDLKLTTLTYYPDGSLASKTDPTGARTEATYDFLGRQVTATQLVRRPGQPTLPLDTTYHYDTQGGWLTSATSPDAARKSATFTYNTIGEMTKVTDHFQNATSYQYDYAGRRTSITLPDSSKQTVGYDTAGRPVASNRLAPSGTVLSTASATYDAKGNMLTSKDARGTTSTFTYNAIGQLTQATQPISGADSITTSFGYDMSGNRTRFTDGRGSVFRSTYNSWNLPESQEEPDGATYTTVYDAVGRVSELRSPGGVTQTHTYDNMDNLTRVTGTGAEISTADRTFGYDGLGRPTSLSGPGGTNTLTYDDRGLLESITGPTGNSSFSYTPDGLTSSRTDAAGTTNYTHDENGRLKTTSNSAAGLDLKYDYNSLSQVEQITYGSNQNRRTLSYDGLHRLSTDELKTAGGSSIGKITYGWDQNSNVTSKATTGFAGGGANTYTYDLANRLSNWNNGSSDIAYEYDKSGNRIRAGAKTFTYSPNNRLQTASDGTTYEYTARGTLKKTTVGTVSLDTVADAFGQVIKQYSSATQFSEYEYDGLGRVVQTGFAYTGTGNSLAKDTIATYVRGPNGGLLGSKVGSGATYAWTDLHTDVVGQFTANGTGLSGSTTYEPYGKVVGSAGMQGSLGYQSAWTDNQTKRVNMHARWYNTDTGQFDSRDSVDVPNRFNYADNNPLVKTDPTGHWATAGGEDGIGLLGTSDPSVGATGYGVWRAFEADQKRRRAAERARTDENRIMAILEANLPDCMKTEKVHGPQIGNGLHGRGDLCNRPANSNCAHGPGYDRQGTHAFKYCTTLVIHPDGSATFNGSITLSAEELGDLNPVVIASKLDLAAGAYGGYMPNGQPGDKAHLTALLLGKSIRGAAQSQAELDRIKKEAECQDDWWCRNKTTIAAIVAGPVLSIGCATLSNDYEGCVTTAATVTLSVTAAVGCGVISAGTLAAACGIAAAGLVSVYSDANQGNINSWGDAAGSFFSGAAVGAITMGMGAAGGALLRNAGTLTRVTGGIVAGGGTAAVGDYLTTGQISLTNVVMGAALGGLGGKLSGGKGGCKHSFAPSTRILMAGGATIAIADIKVGDRVVATDPETGETTEQPVTALHINEDAELTDLTVGSEPVLDSTGEGEGDRSTRGPTVATLHTTQHHPFWDATTESWVDAANLRPGVSKLIGPDGQILYVHSVRSFTGSEEMRDLTVANIHTYYVLAGETPVLVHNCGDQHVALGLDRQVEGFAKRVGAEHLMQDTDWKRTVWTAANLLKHDKPGFRISFTLDGMFGAEDGVAAAVGQSLSRNARQIGGGTDLEMAFFHDAGTLGKVDFFIGGIKQPNPFS